MLYFVFNNSELCLPFGELRTKKKEVEMNKYKIKKKRSRDFLSWEILYCKALIGWRFNTFGRANTRQRAMCANFVFRAQIPMGRPVQGSMQPPDIDYYKRTKELFAELYVKYGLKPTESQGLNVCVEGDIWRYANLK